MKKITLLSAAVSVLVGVQIANAADSKISIGNLPPIGFVNNGDYVPLNRAGATYGGIISFDALAPSETGNANKFLKTNGSIASWSNLLGSDVPLFGTSTRGTVPQTSGVDGTHFLAADGVWKTSTSAPPGTNGQSIYNNLGSFGAYTMAGDCTLTVPNITCTKVNGLNPFSATNLSTGTLPAARLPAFSGDATSSIGTAALTLATVNSNVGTFGSTTQSAVVTVNAKGLITAVSNATIAATTAVTATNATNTAITDDTSTNATVYPTWVTAATGNLPQKVSSTKFAFNPSTGSVGISTSVPSANAILDLHNATNALYLPVGTTGTRPTASNGMLRYNSTVPQLEAYINNAWVALGSGGAASTFASSGMTTAASGATNATALSAAITTAIAIGTSASSGYGGVQAIGLPAGTYAVSSAVTNSLAAVKLASQAGPVKLNYVGLGTSAVALSMNNDGAPSGDFTANANGANDGCAVNGTNGNINISGPLANGNTSTTSIGLRIGSTTAVGSDDKAMRQSCFTHFQTQFFGYGIQESANNLYMINVDHFQSTYNNCGIATTNANSNVNSGENLAYANGDVSGNNYAFCDQTPNIDHVFGPGISFDNNTTAIFLETSNAGYSTQRIFGNHLEDFDVASPAVNATGICSSGIGANAGNTIYIFDQNKFVWNFTAEVPFNHFQGCVGLSLLNNTFAGYGTSSSNAALSAYYMADANVVLNKVSGNIFSSNVTQKQLISASSNIVQDPTFATGTNTGNFQTTPSNLPTWTIDPIDGCSNLTPTVDTSTVWSAGSGVASMKFTYSAGSNGCSVDSTAFKVDAGDHLLGDIIVNGGTSTGTGTIMGMFFRWIPCNPATAKSASDEIGDDLNDIYGGGARTAAAKVITLLDEIVPPGICWAQMVVNPFGVPSAKSVWILDAEVNKI